MRHKHSLLLFFLSLFCFPSYGYAQQWSGIIAPSRAADWSTAGVEGGIPSAAWTQCGPTIAPYSGTGQTIQTAINNCTANHYVLLGAGTFTLSSGFNLNKSGVVVRGMGADQTFLDINGAASSGCGYFYSDAITMCTGSTPQTTANWTAGYAVGTTRITLASGSGIAVGTVLLLNQLDEARDGWPATGDLYICSTMSSLCAWEGGGSGQDRSGRAAMQAVKVTNVVGGNQFDISPAISLPGFRSGQSPQAMWASSPGAILTNAGLEDLSIDHTDVGQVGVMITNTLNCWVTRVRIVFNGGIRNQFTNHIELINDMHTTIRSNYFYGPTNTANTSYPLSIETVGSALIENNIWQSITGDMVTDGGFSNSVFSYNFFPGHNGPAAILHGGGEMMDLYEGNLMMGFWADVVHGRHALQTIFRNAMVGYRFSPSSPDINAPVHIQTGSRFFNVIGNVMGDPSVYSTYQTKEGDSGSSIYVLGWEGSHGGTSLGNDPNVSRTLLRWGNWDQVTSTADSTNGDQTGTRWCGGSSNTGWSTRCGSTTEVPSSITNFANPIPSTETLPASFYAAARPTWWPAGKAWPIIGPDVTGGNIANMGGHAYTNPAADCYLNVMGGPINGSGGPLRFSPAACYGDASSSTAPDPPTNVRIIR